MLTRRQFLENGCVLAAGTGAGALIGDARASTGAPDYRALVCIALGGGADSFNMLVPADTSQYRKYKHRRNDLALSPDELLPLGRGNGDGRSYALHRNLREVHELYSAGEIAVLANAGPLEGPKHRSGSLHVPDLSHSDLIARWQLGVADHRSRSGWAGRVADVMDNRQWRGRMPMNISMSGRNVMQLGARTVAADLQSNPYQRRSRTEVGVDFSYVIEQLAERTIGVGRSGESLHKLRLLGKVETESRAVFEDAIADTPAIDTHFAADSFSADLERVARVIAARDKLEASRQIFFIHFDGWDHHHGLQENLAVKLSDLSRGLATFRDALVALGVLDDVTTFTTSEFGRSLESNGSGSDHGWGGHHIVMGGAVQGGRIYGHYPDLSIGNPLDVGGGSFVPTTSMDEYLAEMVLWFGVPKSELPYVLPDVVKFWSGTGSTRPVGMLA